MYLSKSITVLAAREGAKIRCSTVHPGSIDTLMSERILAAIASNAGLPLPESIHVSVLRFHWETAAALKTSHLSSFTLSPTNAAMQPAAP